MAVTPITQIAGIDIIDTIQPEDEKTYHLLANGSLVEVGAAIGAGTTIGYGVRIEHRVVIGTRVTVCDFCSIGDSVFIDEFAVLENRVSVGYEARLGAFCHIGQNAIIGPMNVLSPGLKIPERYFIAGECSEEGNPINQSWLTKFGWETRYLVRDLSDATTPPSD